MIGETSKEVKEVSDIVGQMLSDEDLVDNLAEFIRRLYLKLVDKGFTEDQALRIVGSYGLGSQK